MQYRCEAASVEGFIQQLAVSYVGNGYYFYVKGRIPPGKNPRAVDAKLIHRYGIDISKWARARRKRAGLANMQYLRHERTFVLLATHGQHAFFEQEAATIRDVRRTPIKFSGYSVSHRGGHPHVRIERETYKRLKAYLVDLAIRRSTEHMTKEFRLLHFEPYAPIRRQLLNLLRAVNWRRKQAGLDVVTSACLRLSRRVYRPFSLKEEHMPTTHTDQDSPRLLLPTSEAHRQSVQASDVHGEDRSRA